MSLNCFFGIELIPGESGMTPAIPPQSSLVISQCTVTRVGGGAVTLYAQSHSSPAKYALCTLNPRRNVYGVKLQHIFSESVTFSLEPHLTMPAHSKQAPTAAVIANTFPAVHLTGYFESDGMQGDESESESESDDEEEEEVRMGKGNNNKKKNINSAKGKQQQQVAARRNESLGSRGRSAGATGGNAKRGRK